MWDAASLSLVRLFCEISYWTCGSSVVGVDNVGGFNSVFKKKELYIFYPMTL